MSTLPTERGSRTSLAERGGDTEWVRLTGWGGGASCPCWRWRPREVSALRDGLAVTREYAAQGAIPRGRGRSYGDAAQRHRGLVVDTSRLTALELDDERGIATVGAGVTIGELLAATIARGWIVPVVPGTQHVSIGGAIASDIHGKNHAVMGTFGRHVRSLGLLTAAGEVLEVEQEPGGLFDATVGGMGLTGVIVWARIALRKVSCGMLSVDTDRADDLDQALELLRAPGGEHRVAWLDLVAGKPRGIVTRAAHLSAGEASLEPGTVTRPARAAVPARWPGWLLRPAAVRAFNELRLRLAPKHERGRPEPFARHMFPLDGLEAWPRLYGRDGLLQYQFSVPAHEANVLRKVLDELRRSRVPCFLAVLKDFGPAERGMLSFPQPGWTLALDLPRAAPGIQASLTRCDHVVAAAGGRVYLTKDARLRPDATRAMYPRLEEWQSVRNAIDPEGLWRSDLATRTGLVTS